MFDRDYWQSPYSDEEEDLDDGEVCWPGVIFVAAIIILKMVALIWFGGSHA